MSSFSPVNGRLPLPLKAAKSAGAAWREMCRNSDPLPKRQRYETALSNRIVKAVKLLLKLLGHDRPGKLPNAELRNEPNLEQVAENPVASPVENPPPPPPEPHPAPVRNAPVSAARPQNGTPVAPTEPPAPETTLTPTKSEPESAPKAPPKRHLST
jgi:hypothetical protein